MEGMTVVHAKIGVFLHPSRAANVKQGVHEILNSLLLKYNEEFDGVVLAYLKPKIIGQSARILAGLTPYFHVNLTAKLLIFSPSPGMLIGPAIYFLYAQSWAQRLRAIFVAFNSAEKGKVNKIEKDYIGVVVLGLFNAAIGVSDIREDLYYDEIPQGREWVSESDERHSIRLGSIIRFSVKSLQETEHIIDLCGSLADPNTGCVNWIELPPVTPRKKLTSTEDRPTGDAGRKQKTPKKEKDLLNSHGTPHANDVGRKLKTTKSERDPANSFETPKVHKRKKHAHVAEESMKSISKDSEHDVMPTTLSGHKHKKRKELEHVQTPDIHHRKKKKRRDAVDTQ